MLLLSFAAFTVRHPRSGVAVALIGLGALWLRLHAIEGLADQYERSANGIRVRDNLWWDSAAYFTLAFQIVSNETRTGLLWPIGMPTFVSYVFHWTGIHLPSAKVGFACLQTAIGPLLFFACRRGLRNPALAFLPLVFWSLFLRPMKYAYYFLTEATAMFLLTAWVAVLISRDPRARESQWPWVIAVSSTLFVLSSYARDVIVTLLPAFLAMVGVAAGGRWRDRIASVAGALAGVLALWCTSPLLFANKEFGANLAHFLPIAPKHVEAARGQAEGEGGGLRSGRLLELAATPLRELAEAPSEYVSEVWGDSRRFWSANYRWANRADYLTNVASRELRRRETHDAELYATGVPDLRAGYERSPVTRLLLSERPGGNYGRLSWVVLATAGFGLCFSLRWVALAGLLAYVTLFHALLFPEFTARARAIYLPCVVLLASLGLFAAIERFPPWLRERLGRRAPTA